MPTVHHPSWQQIVARLSDVGVHREVLNRAKAELDEAGSTTIQEVTITDSQLEQLGFRSLST